MQRLPNGYCRFLEYLITSVAKVPPCYRVLDTLERQRNAAGRGPSPNPHQSQRSDQPSISRSLSV